MTYRDQIEKERDNLEDYIETTTENMTEIQRSYYEEFDMESYQPAFIGGADCIDRAVALEEKLEKADDELSELILYANLVNSLYGMTDEDIIEERKQKEGVEFELSLLYKDLKEDSIIEVKTEKSLSLISDVIEYSVIKQPHDNEKIYTLKIFSETLPTDSTMIKVEIRSSWDIISSAIKELEKFDDDIQIDLAGGE